jgi:hypothetical protein
MFCCSITAIAQSRLAIDSNLPFVLSINGTEVNQVPVTAVKVPVASAGQMLIGLAVAGYEPVFEKRLVLKPGTESAFELVRRDEGFVLEPGSEFVILPPSAPATPAMPQVQLRQDLEAYLKELSELHFEKQKLASILGYVQRSELDSRSLQTLLMELEVEEHRLQVLERAIHNISDCEGLSDVPEGFILEKNRERARIVIQSYLQIH